MRDGPHPAGDGPFPAADWRGFAALPLIVALPVIAFAVLAFVFLQREQHRGIEREIVHITRMALQATDLLLADRFSALERLVPLVEAGEMDTVSAVASDVLAVRSGWLALAVRHADGSLAMLAAAGDAPLADSLATVEPSPGRTARVLVDEQRGPFLMLAVPVRGAVNPSALIAALRLAPFSRQLEGATIPAEWTAAVLDPHRVIAARSRSPADFIGVRATESLIRHIAKANESFFYALNQEGEEVYTAISTSPVTGWTAAVGAPAGLLDGPLRRSRRVWIGGGALAAAIVALLTWFVGRTIAERQAAERRALGLELERKAEHRLAEIASHLPGVLYRRVLSPKGEVSYPYVSEGLRTLIGGSSETALTLPRTLDSWIDTFVTPEDREGWRAALLRSRETGEPFEAEWRLRRLDGGHVWVRSMASTHIAPDGTAIWDGVALDVSPLKEAEEALRTRTSMLEAVNRIGMTIAGELDSDRLVQNALDACRNVSGAAFGCFYCESREERREADRLFAISGMDQEPPTGAALPWNTNAFGRAFHGTGSVRSEDVTNDPQFAHHPQLPGMPDGCPVRSYLAVPVLSGKAGIIGGIFLGDSEPGAFTEDAARVVETIAAYAAVALDNARLFRSAKEEIERRSKVEEQQQMLLAELNHRVKNTLAVVLAIAQQTARRSSSLEAFGNVFEGRLIALANAHTLLTESMWQSTDLRALVRTALEPYGVSQEGRISIDGPAVVVRPKQSLSLSLVFHELATNASKYGALSCGGTLRVRWVPVAGSRIVLSWCERCPTPVAAPGDESFGLQLIRLNVTREIGGTVEFRFGPQGLLVEMSLPWEPETGTIGAQA